MFIDSQHSPEERAATQVPDQPTKNVHKEKVLAIMQTLNKLMKEHYFVDKTTSHGKEKRVDSENEIEELFETIQFHLEHSYKIDELILKHPLRFQPELIAEIKKLVGEDYFLQPPTIH